MIPRRSGKVYANSLEAWRDEGILTVWLEVPIDKSALVPVAVNAGFSYHHAHEDYVMLTLMLVEHSYIPPYATHYIGAGGVVLNDSNELLVVREKYGFRGRPPNAEAAGRRAAAGGASYRGSRAGGLGRDRGPLPL